jgi:diguanylate cyclase (GGDEF)-like protein
MKGGENKKLEILRKLLGELKGSLILKDSELTNAINRIRELEKIIADLTDSRIPKNDFDSFHLYLMDCCELLAQENETLKPRIYIDEATGAFNVRYFQSRFIEELNRAVRHKRPLAVVIIAIEDFRTLQESLGLEMGNKILMEAFKSMKDSLRTIDIVVRFREHEFLALLPETSREHARIVEKRIARNVESTSVFDGQTNISFAIRSATKIACFDDFTKSGNQLFQEAMRELFGDGHGSLVPDSREIERSHTEQPDAPHPQKPGSSVRV